MKKYLMMILTACAFLFGFTLSEPAQAKTISTNLYGTFDQIFSVDDLEFDPADLDVPLTTYNHNLGRLSCALTLAADYDESQDKSCYSKLIAGMGGANCVLHGFVATDPGTATKYYTSEMTVQRNGHDCKVLIISVTESTKGKYAQIVSDVMSTELYGLTSANSSRVLSVTDESDRIYNALAARIQSMADDGDFIVWLTGTVRGAAISNDLARRYADAYGTSHVMAYLFGVLSSDKNALSSDDTSKYNSIFNINNLDDIVTHVPLGVGCADWGFRRWGVEVELGLPDDADKRAALKNDINTKYKQYMANVDRTKIAYPAENFEFYPDGQCNGIAIKELMKDISGGTDPERNYVSSINDYYTKNITCAVLKSIMFPNVGADIEQIVLYSFIKDILDFYFSLEEIDGEAIDAIKRLYSIAEGSCRNKCDIQGLLVFVLQHTLRKTDGSRPTKVSDIVDIGTVLKLIGNSSSVKFELYELLLNYLPETYFTFLSCGNTDVYHNTLPSGSVSPVKFIEDSSSKVTVESENAFFSDQIFGAEPTVGRIGCYDLSLTYDDTDKTACDPYDHVKVYFSDNNIDTESTTAKFTPEGEDGYEVALNYDSIKGQYYVILEELNGTIELPLKDVTIGISESETEGKITLCIGGMEHWDNELGGVYFLVVRYDNGCMVDYTVSEVITRDKMDDIIELATPEGTGTDMRIFMVDEDEYAPRCDYGSVN